MTKQENTQKNTKHKSGKGRSKVRAAADPEALREEERREGLHERDHAVGDDGLQREDRCNKTHAVRLRDGRWPFSFLLPWPAGCS